MDIALFLLHVLVGLLFVGHGAQKLFGVFGGHGIEGTARFMESLGLRPGRVHATAAGALEITGGAQLALGLLLPAAAAAIIAVMIAAIVTAHLDRGLWNAAGGYEFNLVLIAVVLTLAAVGGGDYSLDAALGLDLTGTAWGLGSVAAGVLGGLGAVASGRLGGARRGRGAQAQGA